MNEDGPSPDPLSLERDGAAEQPGHADPFATAHLTSDLRRRSVRGGAAVLGAQAIRFAVQLGGMAVLARLITPDAFGRIAMVTAITGFVALFKDLGLTQAIVQRPVVNHAQVSALFWINAAVAAGLALATAAVAPSVAQFYGDPQLLDVTLVLAGMLFLSGLGTQHLALLQRQMRFRALAVINVVSLLVGTVGAILAASLGAAHWALVLQFGLPALVATLLAFIVEPWRPGRPARAEGVGSMLGFGGYLAAFGVVNHFGRKGDDVLIGRVLGASPLGLYSRAYQLVMLPISQINAPMNAVALPALSRLREEPERFRMYFRRALGGITNLSIPVVLFTLASADSVVLLAFGDDWYEAVPLFRAMGLAAVVGTANVVVPWICVPLGKTRRQFIWGVIAVPIMLLAYIIGLGYGVLGVSVSVSLVYALLWLGSLFFCCRGTPIRPRDVLGVMWRPVVAGGAAAFVVAVAGVDAGHSVGSRLLGLSLNALFFAISHAAVLRCLPGGARAWQEGLSLVRSIARRGG